MGEISHQETRELLDGHLNKGKTADDMHVWIKDVFEGMVVYEEDGVTLRATYEIGEGGAVTLGTPEAVKVAYEKFAELSGIQVLRTGTFVSADGREVTFTEDDLDEILQNFKDIPNNKIPMVVDHADGEASALINAMTVGAHVMAYMKELSKSTVAGVSTLVADFGQIPEKAADMIGKQLVRISPEIFNNFIDNDRVPHGKAFKRISFVDRSSIRELPDVTESHLVFDEGPGHESVVLFLHEESDDNKNGGRKKVDEKLKKLQETVDQLTDKFGAQGEELHAAQDIIKKLTEEKTAAVTKLTETELAAHKKVITDFIFTLKEAGKVSPAMEPTLQAFMETLPHGADAATIKFGEAGKETDFDSLGLFIELMEGKEPVLSFDELGEGVQHAASSGDVESLIEKYQEDHSGTSYANAAVAVSKKHPELFK